MKKSPCKIKYIERLQVVLKISERCNLACSYCYYFKGVDDSAYAKPPLMRMGVFNKIIKDLNQMLDDGTVIGTLEIILHGGEPLLFNNKSIKTVLQRLVDNFDHRLNLEIGVQTNGTLISDEFIDIVNHFSIGVGISIDGIKSKHDKYRIFPSGGGSFDKVVSAIQKLQNSLDVNSAPELGVISVISDDSSAVETYSFLVNELNIKRISFLLPDATHDNHTAEGHKKLHNVGESLYKCFELWSKNTDVHFKNVVDYIEMFQKTAYVENKHAVKSNMIIDDLNEIISFRLIIVRSDGELHHYDRFLPLESEKYIYDIPKNILSISLIDYLTSKIFDDMNNIYNKLPSDCLKCKFIKFCKGGDLEHRFSKSNGFDNPSVYCKELQFFYKNINKKLIEQGLSKEYIDEALAI